MADMKFLFCETFTFCYGNNAIIWVIYLSPHSGIKDFNESLFSPLDVINNERKPYYILGDFNLNLIKQSWSIYRILLKYSFYKHSPPPLINKSTHSNRKSETLIDNILSNSDGKHEIWDLALWFVCSFPYIYFSVLKKVYIWSVEVTIEKKKPTCKKRLYWILHSVMLLVAQLVGELPVIGELLVQITALFILVIVSLDETLHLLCLQVVVRAPSGTHVCGKLASVIVPQCSCGHNIAYNQHVNGWL